MKSYKLNKKGVFGLTSVQQFFAIILGVALLAYVIIVVMGTLQSSSIVPLLSATVANETAGYCNGTGYTVSKATVNGFVSPALLQVYNSTLLLPAANCTIDVSGKIVNGTPMEYHTWVNVTYSYNYNSRTAINANNVLGNTSTGISGFFSAINPVYSILAILVIILILVVLVRVVTGGGIGDGKRSVEPQL